MAGALEYLGVNSQEPIGTNQFMVRSNIGNPQQFDYNRTPGHLMNADDRPFEPTLRELSRQLETDTSESRQLLHSISDNPICSISYDKKIPGLFVEWKGYATSNQIRYIHEQLILMLKNHSVRKILADDTRIQTIPANDQKWIIEDWMPRAIEAGLKAAASKKPESFFGVISVSNIQQIAPKELILRSYDDLEDARHWLQLC